MIKRFLGLLVRVLPASRGQLGDTWEALHGVGSDVRSVGSEVRQARAEIDRLTAVLEATLPDLRRKVDGIEVSAATAARRVVVACGPDDVLVLTEVGYVVCAASDHAVIAALAESGDLEPGQSAVRATGIDGVGEGGGRQMIPGIVVVGAGGHAKVIVELLRAMGESVAFCVGGGDGPATCVGVTVLRGDEHLERLRAEGHDRAFVAIGANGARVRIGADLVALGYTLVNAVSPAATVSSSARLGAGVAVMAGAVINADAEIGDLAIVNTGATIDHDCRIGRGAHVGPQCALAGTVEVGDRGFLGVGCKVIPGMKIGSDAMVGAGCVVISALPDGVTAVGVPARILPRPPRA